MWGNSLRNGCLVVVFTLNKLRTYKILACLMRQSLSPNKMLQVDLETVEPQAQQWFMQDYLKERLLHTNGLVSGGEFFHI